MKNNCLLTKKKLLRVKLNLTMRESGILHEILSIVDGGNINDIRKRNIKVGRIFTKLNKAEDISLEQWTEKQTANWEARRCKN